MSDTAIFLFGVMVFGIVLTSTLIGFLRPAYAQQRQEVSHQEFSTMTNGTMHGQGVPTTVLNASLQLNAQAGKDSIQPTIRRYPQTG